MTSDRNSFSDKFYKIETPLTRQMSWNESENIPIIYLYILHLKEQGIFVIGY